jgi:oxygen-independent coproporphyrinogen III oxidase
MTKYSTDLITSAERELFLSYSNINLPRHTSYPIAPVWKQFSEGDKVSAIRSNINIDSEIGLYVHVPFCKQLCNYCGCTREIIPDESRVKADPSAKFIEGIDLELKAVSEQIKNQELTQLHFGGGTPTFLTPSDFQKLMDVINKYFKMKEGAEISVELDPRVTSDEHLEVLAAIGVNRVSLGVQDFDPKVQKAINRIQSFEMVDGFVKKIRKAGIAGVNFDLIYGLPFQTQESIEETLRRTVEISPDRIAFYKLALIPTLFKWQKLFKPSDLPLNEEALAMQLNAISFFGENGYEFLGLDHFAKKTDSLAIANRNGKMQRTFQGMTTHKNINTIGVGPSAISIFNKSYFQNEKSFKAWLQLLESGENTQKGLNLTKDDFLRKEILQKLYGSGTIDPNKIENDFEINFKDYFKNEIKNLKRLEGEGIVKLSDNNISLNGTIGRLLVRVVASVFDAYMPKDVLDHGLKGFASKI